MSNAANERVGSVRIGVQLLSLRPGAIGGVESYVHRVLRAMLPQLGQDRLVLFLRPEAAEAEFWRAVCADPRVESVVEDPARHYGDGYERWNLGLIAAARLDAIFFPLSFFYPRPLPIPVAMHIGDIQHEYFPENFTEEQLAWRRERIPQSIRLAGAVITDSEFSAQCIRECYSSGKERSQTGLHKGLRIHVVPLAGFSEEQVHREPLGRGWEHDCGGRPFILYPAGDWPHKNHETLLRALRLMADRGRPEQLVLTTMVEASGSELRRRIDELGLADRVHCLGCVPTERLIRLYRAARLMAFPSLFEGFGQPLVEAMQLDCPVVASRAGAVVEVAGGAAVHCENEAGAWAEAMIRVAEDAGLRRRLINAGGGRAAEFDWTRCAAEHLRVLRGIAGQAGSARRGMGSAALASHTFRQGATLPSSG